MADESSQTVEDDSSRPKINPDDVGVSKGEADEIIAVLDGMTDEEIEAQGREVET